VSKGAVRRARARPENSGLGSSRRRGVAFGRGFGAETYAATEASALRREERKFKGGVPVSCLGTDSRAGALIRSAAAAKSDIGIKLGVIGFAGCVSLFHR
jgi:hypothetical protein